MSYSDFKYRLRNGFGWAVTLFSGTWFHGTWFSRAWFSGARGILGLVLLLGLNNSPAAATEEELSPPPDIVVSIEPLYEIVSSIAHQVVRPEVVYLTLNDIKKPLSAQQKAMLNNADIIIRAGSGFEPYLDDYIQAQGKKLSNKTITLSLYIPLLDKQQLKEEQAVPLADRQAGSDLRFWMDPRLVKMLTIYIAPKLVAMDPDHTEEYLDNEVLVKDQLKKVEQKMLSLFRQMSLEQKILIAQFNPYLKNRYMSFAEIKSVDNSKFNQTLLGKGQRKELRDCIKQHSFDSIPLNLEYTEKALYAMVHTVENCAQPHLTSH